MEYAKLEDAAQQHMLNEYYIAYANDWGFPCDTDDIKEQCKSDFKAEISARKKRLKDELAQVQPRIDQTYKMMPENEDFNAIEVKIQVIDEEIKDIDKAISDATTAIRKEYEAEQEKQKAANALKSACQQIVFKAKQEAQEATGKTVHVAVKGLTIDNFNVSPF